MPELTDQICALASQLAAATCRWLLLLAEFDRREGWAGVGIRSCAQWLSWRCSMSLCTAYEQLRVANALDELPQVTAEFAAGRLSYSKVRALTRMVAPGTETAVLDIAQSCTAAQFDRLARGYRKAVSPEDGRDRAGQRHLRWHWDDEGFLVLSARLPAEQGATVLAALEAAAEGIAADAPAADASSERTAAADPHSPPAHSPPAHSSPSRAGPQPRADSFAEESAAGAPTPARAEGDDPRVLGRARVRMREARDADALVLAAETALAGTPTRLSGDDRYRVLLHVDLAALGADPGPGSSSGVAAWLDDGPARSVEGRAADHLPHRHQGVAAGTTRSAAGHRPPQPDHPTGDGPCAARTGRRLLPVPRLPAPLRLEGASPRALGARRADPDRQAYTLLSCPHDGGEGGGGVRPDFQ